MVEREEQSVSSTTGSGKAVMLKDGLEDVDSLFIDNLRKDVVGASHLRTAQSVSFSEMCTYTVELPTSEHWRPEVKVAKRAEIKNLQDTETFVEVKDECQTRVGSRWVITEKEQHNGQKTKVKARLVAQGFQETLKPQSDSPTAAKVSFKLLMALAANFHFKLASVDIRAAFLQSKI